MDERKAELKRLKKISNKAKHRYFTVWKVLGIIALSLAAVLVLGGLAARYIAWPYFGHIFLLAAIKLVLHLITLIPWSAGKKRWKKSEEYLNYRTMKRAVRDEKRLG